MLQTESVFKPRPDLKDFDHEDNWIQDGGKKKSLFEHHRKFVTYWVKHVSCPVNTSLKKF